MVILQFNKLIRNKFIWGVFAVLISAFFAFDFLLDDLRGDRTENRSSVGQLGDEAVNQQLFQALTDDVRGFGQNRDWRRAANEVNLEAWKTLAAIRFAEANSLEPTTAELQEIIRNDRNFQREGGFNFALYNAMLRENGLSPERYEEFLRRRVTMQRVYGLMAEVGSWASPAEVDRAVADMTDQLTVKVARFKQEAPAAAKVTVDEAAVKAWYDENVKSLALPERIKIRYLKYDATDKAAQAKVEVTEDAMRDRYDVTIDRYTSTDTNGVETVKKFEEVKGEIEAELRLLETVTYFETNLNQRVWDYDNDQAGASRLEALAKEDGLKIATSDWFTTGAGYQDGFMKRVSAILPGAKELAETAATLDSESPDYRYGIVLSDKAVWVIEKGEVSPAHTPSFEEAKEVIRPRALKDAKAKAFKAEVEKIIAGGKEAVLKAGEVSTNLVFSVVDLHSRICDDQPAVLRAAVKLAKGEVSGFELTGPGRALVVVCEDRVAGDPTKALVMRSQLRSEVESMQRRQVAERWAEWNLETTGFTPGEGGSVAPQEAQSDEVE